MALIFPNRSQKSIAFPSEAEKQFYESCEIQLGSDWRVYYSCTLSALEGEKGLVDNEIDFVLYHPKLGLIVVEVKGGQIAYDPEKASFYSMNRYGKSFAIKNPFQQSLNWKSRFLRLLRSKGVRLPVSHAVCFPQVHEKDLDLKSSAIAAELIIGTGGLRSLESTLDTLVRKSQPEKFLSFSDQIETIDELLRGAHYESPYYLKSYIDMHEVRVKDLEYLHQHFVLPIANHQRIGIEGGAGTGKSLLAALLSKHFHAEGKKVLVLTSNKSLAQKFRTELPEGIFIDTYEHINPQAVANRKGLFEVLIADEAQDVEPELWGSILSQLGQPEHDSVYLFFDGNQKAPKEKDSKKDSAFRPEHLPLKGPYFPLVNNYRNTRQISLFSAAYRTMTHVLLGHSTRQGFLPEIISYKNEEDARQKLRNLEQRLYETEGLNAQDIHILSGRKITGGPSILREEDKAWLRSPTQTIQAFKGLESSVSILINLSEYQLSPEHPLFKNLVYVGSTRAKHMLYIFVKEGDAKHESFAKALAELRAQESFEFVVSHRHSLHGFQAEVASYDPRRFGLLRLAAKDAELKQVLFFPEDLSPELRARLKVGDVLSFKIKSDEGFPRAFDIETLVRVG